MRKRNAKTFRVSQTLGECVQEVRTNTLTLVEWIDIHAAQHRDRALMRSSNQTKNLVGSFGDVDDVLRRDAPAIAPGSVEVCESIVFAWTRNSNGELIHAG